MTLRPISIDGQFEDWSRDDIAAIDPASDAEGAFDISRLSLRSHGSLVFVRFDA
jgi:hypothetical protein